MLLVKCEKEASFLGLYWLFWGWNGNSGALVQTKNWCRRSESLRLAQDRPFDSLRTSSPTRGGSPAGFWVQKPTARNAAQLL